MAALAEKVRNYGVYVLTIWPGTLVWDLWVGGLFVGEDIERDDLMTTTFLMTNASPPKSPMLLENGSY